MADHMGRNDRVDGDGISEGPAELGGSREGHDPSRESGSPLGTDPQEASPLPGDPREAQEPQEPRTSHVAPGREDDESHPSRASDHETSDDDADRGAVDHLRDAWDRMRGKK
jgi:hypothetical protein